MKKFRKKPTVDNEYWRSVTFAARKVYLIDMLRDWLDTLSVTPNTDKTNEDIALINDTIAEVRNLKNNTDRLNTLF